MNGNAKNSFGIILRNLIPGVVFSFAAQSRALQAFNHPNLFQSFQVFFILICSVLSPSRFALKTTKNFRSSSSSSSHIISNQLKSKKFLWNNFAKPYYRNWLFLCSSFSGSSGLGWLRGCHGNSKIWKGPGTAGGEPFLATEGPLGEESPWKNLGLQICRQRPTNPSEPSKKLSHNWQQTTG